MMRKKVQRSIIVASLLMSIQSLNAADYTAGGGTVNTDVGASGSRAVAIGDGAIAEESSPSLGINGNIALGAAAYAWSNLSLGLPYTSSLAIGAYSSAANDGVAVGGGAQATGTDSVSIGKNANSWGIGSISIGNNSQTDFGFGDHSIAIGDGSSAYGDSMGFGHGSHANGDYSMAYGVNSDAQQSYSMAFGYGASTVNAGDVVFSSTGVIGASVFNLGGRTLTGYKIAAPTAAGDIVTKAYADAIYNNAVTYTNTQTAAAITTANAYTDTAVSGVSGGGGSTDLTPVYNAISTSATNVYNASTAYTDTAVSGLSGGGGVDYSNVTNINLGLASATNGTMPFGQISLGVGATTGLGINDSSSAIAIGTFAIADGMNTVAYGAGAEAHYFGSVAIGSGARAMSDPTTAVGYNSLAAGTDSVSLGANSTANAEHATSLGANTVTTADYAVSIGDGSTNNRSNTVSVGSSGNERQITNVAAGVLDTDAVNVGQLNQTLQSANGYTDQKINDLEQNLRGEIAEGTALAMALSSPAIIENGRVNAMSIGVGQYKSATALGISYSRRATRDTFVNVGVSAVGQNVAARSSVNFSF
ncbi:YadA family autotransporter adhesin [Sulfuricurvum sp.]|uniref:YadA family autotransporter adhesin n=1 Tax=Sulfuricurvum sp. TaxID=2025608 RepID=UPI003BB67CBA